MEKNKNQKKENLTATRLIQTEGLENIHRQLTQENNQNKKAELRKIARSIFHFISNGPVMSAKELFIAYGLITISLRGISMKVASANS